MGIGWRTTRVRGSRVMGVLGVGEHTRPSRGFLIRYFIQKCTHERSPATRGSCDVLFSHQVIRIPKIQKFAFLALDQNLRRLHIPQFSSPETRVIPYPASFYHGSSQILLFHPHRTTRHLLPLSSEESRARSARSSRKSRGRARGHGALAERGACVVGHQYEEGYDEAEVDACEDVRGRLGPLCFVPLHHG